MMKQLTYIGLGISVLFVVGMAYASPMKMTMNTKMSSSINISNAITLPIKMNTSKEYVVYINVSGGKSAQQRMMRKSLSRILKHKGYGITSHKQNADFQVMVSLGKMKVNNMQGKTKMNGSMNASFSATENIYVKSTNKTYKTNVNIVNMGNVSMNKMWESHMMWNKQGDHTMWNKHGGHMMGNKHGGHMMNQCHKGMCNSNSFGMMGSSQKGMWGASMMLIKTLAMPFPMLNTDDDDN